MRSVLASLITTFILAGILGNAVIDAQENILLNIVISGVVFIAAVIIIIELMYKVNHMKRD